VSVAGSSRHSRAALRRAAAWGAQAWPDWFVRSAPVALGLACALILPRFRQMVRRNLELIFGEGSARWRDILQTFIEFARSLTASLAPERPLFRKRRVELWGMSHVERFFDEGRGMLMVTAHVGPWDASALRLRKMMNVPVMMLMSPELDESAGAFHDDVREGAQVRVVRAGRSPLDLLPLVEHIRKGGIIVAQIDRVPPGAPALQVPLFGKAFQVPSGLFRMARALECPLVPTFAARLDATRDAVILGEPIFLSSGAGEREFTEAASRCTAQLERHLRAFPTQWFHFVEIPHGEVI
jgi:lauroyl/myristoyl acyltransferase